MFLGYSLIFLLSMLFVFIIYFIINVIYWNVGGILSLFTNICGASVILSILGFIYNVLLLVLAIGIQTAALFYLTKYLLKQERRNIPDKKLGLYCLAINPLVWFFIGAVIVVFTGLYNIFI